MRVCLVYDCLFPHTVGGAERWLRAVAERLTAEGHEVTYLTLRQWDRGVDPGVPGVRVAVAGPRMALYVDGRRRILPPLVFGAGVLWHLARHGQKYDVVHTASFPFFSLLSAAMVRPIRRYGLVVDWYEVWTLLYWREYLGSLGGRVGHAIQRLCLRVPQRAFCFSRLHARRMREEGFGGEVTVLEGMFEGMPAAAPEPRGGHAPEVVFAGRHIPEKRVPVLVPAIVAAAQRIPGLHATIFGDGPQRPDVLAAIERLGAGAIVRAPGFVDAAVLDAAMSRALCLVLASRREGYGLVVVEAASRGTPVVVVDGPDNAAVELVTDGVNGVVARSASPEDLAAAIEQVSEGGAPLRASTAAWYADNAQRLSVESSLERVVASYGT